MSNSFAPTESPPLAAPLERRAGPWSFRLATPADDPAIRQFLRTQSMDGPMKLAAQTEPSFFQAASLLGTNPQVLIAKHAGSDEIGGLGVRTMRQLRLNSPELSVGHLSYLRVASHSRRDFLRAGYGLLHDLHQRDDAAFYLTAILKDNLRARRLLEAGLPGLPIYQPLTPVVTLTMSTSNRRLMRRTDSENDNPIPDRNEILHCILRNSKDMPFAPSDDDQSFSGKFTAAPTWNDFVTVTQNGTVHATAALWDQRQTRQIVVAAYRPALRIARPLINTLRAIHGRGRLPAVGNAVNLAYISRLAIDENPPELLHKLLVALAAKARRAGIEYLALSLAASHPLLPCAQRYAMHRMESILYAVRWPKDPPIEPAVGIPYVEAAQL